MVFQSNTPIIHKVYFTQFNLVKQYFSYFISPDHLDNVKRGGHLTSLSINESLLPKNFLLLVPEPKNYFQPYMRNASKLYTKKKSEKCSLAIMVIMMVLQGKSLGLRLQRNLQFQSLSTGRLFLLHITQKGYNKQQ